MKKLIETFKLGELLEQPILLHGGALHTMLKIKTESGCYAVKQLNPHVTAKKDFKKFYEFSEKIAEEMYNQSVPAVSSLKFDGNHVISIDSDYFIIYPFIDGKILDEADFTLEHAHRVGQLYALMHSTSIHTANNITAQYDYFENEHWQKLIQKSQHPALMELLPVILNFNQRYRSTIPRLANEFVITHRDMHAQNIMWDKQHQPHIVDWESAGLMNPLMEVIGYGLEWSGVILHQKVNMAFFETLLKTYLNQNENQWQTRPEEAFYGWLGHCVLAWTEFNIRRMIGEISLGDTEISKGHEIINQKMIPCLQYLKSNELQLLDQITLVK
ncbi:serine/threonine protein kinase [Legionella pneumophila]|uniref:phosphotransferase n=1 Tax=Legionella pneumophila TaxID=446 RepID=UPI000770B33A|nr:phosphotransferase [Legionella pneumophila]CZG38845.1 serine/threonine protein kinase [Legionella pneumophila]CZH40113.1 serine/threonine protein kinase [Legionella pneumophila]